MHYPNGGEQIYLIAHATKGVKLDQVVESLNGLPSPYTEDDWDGESAPTLPVFFSPGRIAQSAVKRPEPALPRRPAARGKTASYVQAFVGPQRRPTGRMPIEAHAEIGQLIKWVLIVSKNRRGVYSRLDSVRSELDEWVARESSISELDQGTFFGLYFGEYGFSYARSLMEPEKARHIASFFRVDDLLGLHYSDCVPLRLLKRTQTSAIKPTPTIFACFFLYFSFREHPNTTRHAPRRRAHGGDI